MDQNRESDERYFRDICFDLVKLIAKENEITYEDLDTSRIEWMRAFESPDRHRAMRYCDLDPIKACSYVATYVPMSCGLVRHRVLDALTGCQEFRCKFESRKLRILDLGCGIGTDVVGFCSALQAVHVAPYRMLLEFTLVDKAPIWSYFASRLENLIWRRGSNSSVGEFFRRNIVNMEFICRDLQKLPEKDSPYLKILENADIILITRLLMHLDDGSLLENIHKNMNSNALIILIEPETYIKLYLNEEKFEIMYWHPKTYESYQLMPSIYEDNNVLFTEFLCKSSNNKVVVCRKRRLLNCQGHD